MESDKTGGALIDNGLRFRNVLNKSIHLNLFLNYCQKNTLRYMKFLRQDRDFCYSKYRGSRQDREHFF